MNRIERDQMLHKLAEGRRRRLQATGRPLFELTREDIAESTAAVMHLAGASRSPLTSKTHR